MPCYLPWKEEKRLFQYIRELPAAEMPYEHRALCVEERADIQIESPQVPLIILAEID
jgi:hypothetical protein